MNRTEIKFEFDKFFDFPSKDQSSVTSVSALLFAEHIAQLERSKAPAWHDAPTCAGMWLNSINMQTEVVKQRHIDACSYVGITRWYGPIPQEPST